MLQAAIRERRWRRRRFHFGSMTVLVGVLVPGMTLLGAGAISAGAMTSWLDGGGWLPLAATMAGGGACAALVFLRGWGVALGMVTFGLLFMGLVATMRGTLAILLPAMPGLVALFVMAGALVGHLTTLEEGD